MRKINLVVAVILLAVGAQAQSLKGYTIGEKLVGSEIKVTSVAGIDGAVFASTLNDGTIYALSFIPSDDGKNVARVHLSEINNLVSGVEKNYDVKLKTRKAEYEDHIERYYYYSSTVNISIGVEHNQFFDQPYDIALMIYDNDLYNLYEREQKNKTAKDF